MKFLPTKATNKSTFQFMDKFGERTDAICQRVNGTQNELTEEVKSSRLW